MGRHGSNSQNIQLGEALRRPWKRAACLRVSAKLDADMVAGFRASKLQARVRGVRRADLDTVAGAITGVSELAVEFGEHIEALNLRPLISRPGGAVAVDALAVPRRTTPPVS